MYDLMKSRSMQTREASTKEGGAMDPNDKGRMQPIGFHT